MISIPNIISGSRSVKLITIIINLRTARDHNILVKISPEICHPETSSQLRQDPLLAETITKSAGDLSDKYLVVSY